MKMEQILSYLSDLEQNNNREWFHANKPQYQAAVQAFEELVEHLLCELRQTDDSLPLFAPRELCFKLMRDTRFSRDKTPYNPSFRAHIAPKGRLPVPVGSFYPAPAGKPLLSGRRAVCGHVQRCDYNGAGRDYDTRR